MHTYLCMRTTIELQDALFREVKVVAAERGMSLKELFTVAIEQCIHDESSQGARMTEPPVVLETATSIGPVLNAELASMEDEEILKKIG